MANYETLKAAIQQVAKPNGNNEITGTLLQQLLLAMTNSLGVGYQFVGVATPGTKPGTPDQKVFYIANGKGTYTNFGNIEVTEDEVVVLYYDTEWHKVATGIASQAKLSVLNAMVNALGAGYQFAGVATPDTNPGSPDAKVFYIANGKGTYTNFGGIQITEDSVVMLYWDTAWHKLIPDIASYTQLAQVNNDLLENKDSIGSLDAQINGGFGLKDFTAQMKASANTANKGIDTRDGGYLTFLGAAASDYLPIIGGRVIYLTVATINSTTQFHGYAFYDKSKTFISGVKFFENLNINHTKRIVVPNNAHYIRTTYLIDENTYGKVEYFGVNLETGITKDFSILNNRVSELIGFPVKIQGNQFTRSEISGVTNAHLYTFVLGHTIINNAEIVFNQSLKYSDGVFFYDKYGYEIGEANYAAARPSVIAPIGTYRFALRLRDAYYNENSIIMYSCDALIGDVNKISATYNYCALSITDDKCIPSHSHNDYRIIGRFPVIGGKRYAFAAGAGLVTTQPDKPYVSYFDKNGNNISYEQMLSVNDPKDRTCPDYATGYKFTSPENAAFIFISVSISSINAPYKLSLWEDVNITTKNEDYNIWVLGDSLSASGYNADISPWKSVNAIGGWISAFLAHVSTRPLNWINYSQGGWTLTDISGDLTGNSFLNRLEQVIAAYQGGTIVAPDVIFIVGCTNDIDQGVKRNITDEEITASEYSNYDEYCEHTFFTATSGNYNSRVLLTDYNKGKIIGAMRYIVERAGTLFPNCKFFFVTPPQSSRKSIENQIACCRDMKWAAARLCVPIADVWGEAQMPMLWDYNADWLNNPTHFRFLDDGIHTYDSGAGRNVIGYKRQGEYIARKFCETFRFDLGINW